MHQPRKVPTKIYILSCVHISLKINMSLIQITSATLGDASHSLGTSDIESDYRLDDKATGARSPAEAKNFSSSNCVQTGSWAHPASSVTLVPLVPRSSKSRSYFSFPFCRLHGGRGTALLACITLLKCRFTYFFVDVCLCSTFLRGKRQPQQIECVQENTHFNAYNSNVNNDGIFILQGVE
jgi:hypothetical protein